MVYPQLISQLFTSVRQSHLHNVVGKLSSHKLKMSLFVFFPLSCCIQVTTVFSWWLSWSMPTMQALDIRLQVSLLLPGKYLLLSGYDLYILYSPYWIVVMLKLCLSFQGIILKVFWIRPPFALPFTSIISAIANKCIYSLYLPPSVAVFIITGSSASTYSMGCDAVDKVHVAFHIM